MTTPTSWEDSVETTIREIRALSSAKCGQIIDTTQVIGSLAQNLNQQNMTSEQDNDAARARELMMQAIAETVTTAVATTNTVLGSSRVARTSSVISQLTSVPGQLTDQTISGALEVLQAITGDRASQILQTDAARIIASVCNNILTAPDVSTAVMTSRTTSVQAILLSASASIAARMVAGENPEVLSTEAFAMHVQRFGNDTDSGVKLVGDLVTMPLQSLTHRSDVSVQVVEYHVQPLPLTSPLSAVSSTASELGNIVSQYGLGSKVVSTFTQASPTATWMGMFLKDRL